jgi:hypothetical protein
MFQPNSNILSGSGNFLVKCVNNATATDKENNIYRPRMTLMKRMTKKGIETPLKIEFSVAKMLRGNNVDEVQESNFDAVVKLLRRALDDMGVIVPSLEIETAKVSAFHPSKNIELMDGYTSSFVIKELKKINVSMKMDVNKDSYRDGHSLQFYTNSHSLVVYDKLYDLKKPMKRAMDKDQNYLQNSLFDVIAEVKKEKRQLLRIEVRLAKKVKMNALLKDLGFKTDPTFRDVFRKNICQKVLLDYWDKLIMGQNLFLFDMEDSANKTLAKIYNSRPGINAKEAVYLAGLWALSKEGIRETRTTIEQHASSRTWYRVAKDLPVLDEISSKMYHGWVKQVRDALDDFVPYRLST